MRFSATMLEQFRLYTSEDWKPLHELLAVLRRDKLVVPTTDMVFGGEVHRIIERPNRYRDGPYFTSDGPFKVLDTLKDRVTGAVRMVPREVGPWTFDLAELLEHLGPGLTHELAGEFEVDEHLVAARADAMRGNEVQEWKVKGAPALDRRSGFDADSYYPSFQWRVYCEAFGAARVVYVVIELKDWGGVYRVMKVHRLSFYPYQRLREDVREQVRWLARFCRDQRIYP